MVELRVLGGVDLRSPGGEEIRSVLQQPKRLALLAYLAAAAPRGFHRRDTLHALFWPELDTAAARNALGQAIHFLRHEVGEGVVVNRGRGELGVYGEAIRCDAARFEQALDEGRAAEALELYRGELLEGFHVSGVPEFERWTERERARLRGRAVEAARELAESCERAEELEGAVRWARTLGRLDPFDERSLRRLLTLLERSGDRSGALQAYDEFVRRLHGELQVKPSVETRRLAQGLRAAKPDGPTPAPDSQPSLAVLPFLDLSPTPEEYFADGITEELISALATVEGLRVTSRTSSFAFKGRAVSMRSVAEELGVAAVLEGSVRHGAGRVRITAQLIDARTDAHLWTESYDRELTDFLTIQTEVAEQIARALRVELSAATRERIGARPTGNPRAFHLYLRGRHHWNQGSREAWPQTLELFRLAIEEDPRFALAYAGLADTYLQPALFHFAPPLPRAESLARGKVAAMRALELNDELGEAHAALAVVRWYGWDWQGAERAFRRAIALSPGYVTAHHRYGLCLAFLGRFEEAAAELRRAQELDPLSLSVAVDRGVVELRAGRLELAMTHFRKVLEVDPGFYPAHHYLGEAYAYSGQHDLSTRHWAARGIITPAEADTLCETLRTGGLEAYRRELLAVLERLEGAPTVVASLLARLGEMERGWEMLERAFQERDPVLTDGVRVHPGLDPFRPDPRFAELLRRMGVEEG